jgi:hypothetical protein
LFPGRKTAIDPAPTPDELRHADEFLDAIREAAERNLFEAENDGSERTLSPPSSNSLVTTMRSRYCMLL